MSFSPSHKSQVTTQPVTVVADIGELVCKIRVPVLAAQDSRHVDLDDVQPLASYSWVEGTTPTMLVPGSPPIWTEPSLPFTVQKDNFTAFVDQNGHRVPKHPLLPLVAAVLHMEPEFYFSAIDIITDRNSLRKLLRWIRGAELDSSVKDFQFDMELAGKTMLFTRRETKTTELANRGYGLGFEKLVTKTSTSGPTSTGHHRIVRYNIDGLELLVRFELDACLPETKAATSTDVSSLLASLHRVGISGASEATTPISTATGPASVTVIPIRKLPVSHGINIISSGSLVPQSRTIELTTCSKKFVHTFSWAEAYPQLYLSQTAHHFLGIHDFGRFSAIEKCTTESLGSGRVGEQVEGDLKKLAKALHDIYGRVVAAGEGVLLHLECVGGVLSLRKRNSNVHALPDNILDLLKA